MRAAFVLGGVGMALDVVEVSRAIADLQARVENLEGWQKTQNGHLQRIEEKLDNLKDSSSKWLTGLLGGMVTTLIMLIINLVLMRGGR